jgi:hypothetical protein
MRHDQQAGDPTLILVFGILGLVMCQLFGIPAWVMGNNYMRRCRELGIEPESSAVAGRVCGIISSVMLILGLLAMCVYFGFVFLAIGAGVAGA